jgi:UPF0755 protein
MTRRALRRFLFVLLAVAVAGAAAVGLAGAGIYRAMHAPHRGFDGEERFVDIPSGASPGEIRRRLVEAGVVSDERLFRVALWWTGQARSLQAGEYRFSEPLTPVEVIDRIARGDVHVYPLTFPEGLTIAEMAVLYEARGFGTREAFAESARDPSLIADLDPDAGDLEGYLFPETYALPRGTPAATLVRQMVERFRVTYTALRPDGPREGDLAMRDLVTLASLVEKETARADERPLVASVYHNRLRRGMLMQADPTVVYALVLAGTYDGNIRRSDLEIDSPYNTYRYPGLPPGPIAAPGRAALAAALEPAESPYLYFVSRNDGSHAFAETLAAHNANVYEHQVLYFRRQRQAQ